MARGTKYKSIYRPQPAVHLPAKNGHCGTRKRAVLSPHGRERCGEEAGPGSGQRSRGGGNVYHGAHPDSAGVVVVGGWSWLVCVCIRRQGVTADDRPGQSSRQQVAQDTPEVGHAEGSRAGWRDRVEKGEECECEGWASELETWADGFAHQQNLVSTR